MDRNNRRVKYLTGANTTFKAYGMNDEKKKKNKKKNTVQGVIRTVILALALIGLLALCVTYALTGSTRESVGRVSRIGATLSQNGVALRRQREFSTTARRWHWRRRDGRQRVELPDRHERGL